MNTLLLSPEIFSSEGGIPRILRLYLKALCEQAKAEDEVRFVTLNDGVVDSTDLRLYGGDKLVEWEACDRKKLRFVWAALKMSRHSDRIICGHIGQLPVAWAASRLRKNIRYFLVAHGIEVWRPFTLIERKALTGAHRIFCVSEFTRQEILKRISIPEKKLIVLPNALDPRLEAQSISPGSLNPPIILTVSRLSIADSYKGIKHLIAAMPAILLAEPAAKLRVVGRGDGLRRLQSLSREHGVADSVEFPGFVSDELLHDEFQRCRLFALPSQKEGFGLVYLEAMAHGRPCLGAREGGIPEVITEETGSLVEFGNVPAIAEACIVSLRREWAPEVLVERSRLFSYGKFKDRLSSALAD